jgi:hypothetical protein
LATARAKSFAVFFAERAAGQGEKHLFAHDIFKRETALFIIADFGLVEGNGALAGLCVCGLGAEDEVEVAGERGGDGFDAAGAEEFEVALVGGAQADVGDLLAVTAVFDDEVGAAGDGERADLGDVGGVVERAGKDGFREEEGLFFELEGGDEHTLRVGGWGVEVNGRGGRVP